VTGADSIREKRDLSQVTTSFLNVTRMESLTWLKAILTGAPGVLLS